ncbi:unnamed protein product [Prorocentrum cordatum]|uniref:tRNA threonylcarbamoyladenosine biosynthesis protein TsaE n=1 Tax=Prorocentrum cordatum TaxID=2364126 RepID=A0ABN9XBH9_9DINO|nr:unnamed protein product [Polarella glacialis]
MTEASAQVALPDVEATEALGAALAHEVQRGDIIFLRGELGSGKTSLAKGFLRRFFGNPSLDVPSPSYLLHFSYCDAACSSGANPPPAEATVVAFSAGARSLVPGCPAHHVDPYRLPVGKIAALLDFEKIFSEVALVEWPDRLGDQLCTSTTPARLEVFFEGFGPQGEGRVVSLSAVGERWQRAVDRRDLGLGGGGPVLSCKEGGRVDIRKDQGLRQETASAPAGADGVRAGATAQ